MEVDRNEVSFFTIYEFNYVLNVYSKKLSREEVEMKKIMLFLVYSIIAILAIIVVNVLYHADSRYATHPKLQPKETAEVVNVTKSVVIAKGWESLRILATIDTGETIVLQYDINDREGISKINFVPNKSIDIQRGIKDGVIYFVDSVQIVTLCNIKDNPWILSIFLCVLIVLPIAIYLEAKRNHTDKKAEKKVQSLQGIVESVEYNLTDNKTKLIFTDHRIINFLGSETFDMLQKGNSVRILFTAKVKEYGFGQNLMIEEVGLV